jgi:hypothetical protein
LLHVWYVQAPPLPAKTEVYVSQRDVMPPLVGRMKVKSLPLPSLVVPLLVTLKTPPPLLQVLLSMWVQLPPLQVLPPLPA